MSAFQEENWNLEHNRFQVPRYIRHRKGNECSHQRRLSPRLSIRGTGRFSHLYGMRVGRTARKAGRLYRYFFLRALRAAITAIIEEQARAEAAIRFDTTPVWTSSLDGASVVTAFCSEAFGVTGEAFAFPLALPSAFIFPLASAFFFCSSIFATSASVFASFSQLTVRTYGVALYLSLVNYLVPEGPRLAKGLVASPVVRSLCLAHLVLTSHPKACS